MRGYVKMLIEDTAKEIYNLEPNTLVKHDILRTRLDCISEKESVYMGRVQRLIDLLKEEYGVFFLSNHGSGYVYMAAENSIEKCKKKFDKGIKGLYDAVSDTQHINYNKIPDDQKYKTIHESTKMATLVHMIKMGTQKVKELK